MMIQVLHVLHDDTGYIKTPEQATGRLFSLGFPIAYCLANYLHVSWSPSLDSNDEHPNTLAEGQKEDSDQIQAQSWK